MFDDLGLDPQSAQEMKIKYKLHKKLIALIERKGCSPRELEKILDVPQPRVSELMRGKLSTLSFSRLLYYAKLLGAEAEIVLSETRAA